MIRTVREFAPADRYVYDFGLCRTQNGFAQVDSDQDASYYGTWANPTKRAIVNYCEGDVTLYDCDTEEEFAAKLREMSQWHVDNGFRPLRIDPGFSEELAQAFRRIGLKDLLDGAEAST